MVGQVFRLDGLLTSPETSEIIAYFKADLKTFTALRCYGTSVITAVLAQNSQGVQDVEPMSPQFVQKQVRLLTEVIKLSFRSVSLVTCGP